AKEPTGGDPDSGSVSRPLANARVPLRGAIHSPPMRIARLELDQIGPFDEATIEIPIAAEDQRGELVVFEGPSGSGKTALLQAIPCAAAPPPGSSLLPPLRDAVQRSRAPSGAVRVTLEHGGETFTPTLDAEGLRWPADVPTSTIAGHIEAAERAAQGTPT